MKQYKTQVIIASGQPVPNVTPVLDDKIRPEKVVICSSDKMITRSESLSSFFKTKNIEAEIFRLGNAYEFAELQNRFLELAVSLDENSTAVNLTGGTKLMTIAAQSAFGTDFECFYVIPEEDSIVMINSGDNGKYEIQDKLKLTDFFLIHGYKVQSIKESVKITSEMRQLFKDLLNNYDKTIKQLGTLNYLASCAEDKNTLSVQHSQSDRSIEVLSSFYSEGSISYYDDQKVVFKDVVSRDFCKGKWLEDFTYLEMLNLDKEVTLQDFACSVEVVSPGGTKNEIDAAFLYNNALYIIECKTAVMDHKGTDVLYKIDTIKDYAGMFTRPIIVTMNSLTRYDKQRAEDLGINVIEGGKLKSLSSYLKNIIK